MNKRGNIYFGVFIGLFIFIAGVLFIPFLRDDITTSRDALDCTNPSITDGTKLTCLGVDTVMPYLIWFFVSIAIGYIMGGRT